MMSLNNIITLDQLEDVEYMYKVISTVLPTLCLDHTIDERYKHTYIHPFDVLFSQSLETLVDPIEYDMSVQKIGISYLLDYTSSQSLFSATVKPGIIEKTQVPVTLSERSNPIIDTHTYNDLPVFTKDLIKIRVTSCEGHARIVGGYVESLNSIPIMSPIPMPNLSFSNTYLLNLLYSDVIGTDTGFRARLVDGVMLAKDVHNLLEIRALLSPASRLAFDRDYGIEKISQDYNITINQNPVVNTDLATMPYRYLIMFFQYFNTRYMLRDLTYNGNSVIIGTQDILNFVASLHFQRHITTFKIHAPGVHIANNFNMRVRLSTGQVITNIITIPGVEFIDISGLPTYYITLLNMISRSEKTGVHKLIATKPSLFWDGIPYTEYKNMTISEMLFIGATCYIFGLYEHNGVTYCSLLNNILTSGYVPTRVCLLVRTIAGKTVPQILSDILQNINSMSYKDFPKRSTCNINHIGLDEAGFMRFFQYLRLMANKSPDIALKEVLMAYAGLKIESTGPPHPIKKESYKEFVALLFSAMGYKVTFKKHIISSHKHVTVTISPRVNKAHIANTLIKASCTKEEAEKIMASAHELLQFMVSVGDLRDSHSYNISRISRSCSQASRIYPNIFNIFSGGNICANNTVPTEETDTVIDLIEQIPILERINIRGIMSANTIDELLDTDFFMPETIAFKHNLSHLMQTNQLNGENVVQIMPLSLIDRYIQVGGGSNKSVTIGDVLDTINEGEDDGRSTSDIVEVINNALKDHYIKDHGAVASQALNTVTSLAGRQLDTLRQSTCGIATLFKQLAKAIYGIESIFKVPISDDVKEGILYKFKLYTELSRELYLELIALETTRAIMYILRRSGKYISDTEIGTEELKKAYDVVRPKIARLTNYYTDISKTYFDQMKKNLNMINPDSITFDVE
ncbi:P4a precursor [Sea otter poxvirus]|uniref:P4a n=1 Tax=Sea otter poxvirus TaxID=1416741 RepID=A0A2U9QHR8_9POXV|nr:P4a precursor [Sea otter poxvirus]AWU47144.1 P4a precursor [Sea otter poxvirus]